MTCEAKANCVEGDMARQVAWKLQGQVVDAVFVVIELKRNPCWRSQSFPSLDLRAAHDDVVCCGTFAKWVVFLGIELLKPLPRADGAFYFIVVVLSCLLEPIIQSDRYSGRKTCCFVAPYTKLLGVREVGDLEWVRCGNTSLANICKVLLEVQVVDVLAWPSGAMAKRPLLWFDCHLFLRRAVTAYSESMELVEDPIFNSNYRHGDAISIVVCVFD